MGQSQVTMVGSHQSIKGRTVTRPNEVLIGYKHGMYDTGKITERDLADFTLREPVRKDPKKFTVKRGTARRK